LKNYEVGLKCPRGAIKGMEIERIVKNSPAYRTYSHRQVIFCYSHRNEIPGRITNGSGRGCLERPSATIVGQIAIFFSSCRNLMVRTGE